MRAEEPLEAFRSGISEALHAGALSRLRTVLTGLLGRKHQVILLIDNLDKPWTRSADLDHLAEFAGVLSVEGRHQGVREGAHAFGRRSLVAAREAVQQVLGFTAPALGDQGTRALSS